MTPGFKIFLAAVGSAAMLLAAWGFQYLGDLAPCKMCIWQRWPHAAAVGIAVLGVAITGWIIPVLGAIAVLTTAAIGLYHTGVERAWWEGPNSCTSSDISGLNTDELFESIMAAPLVQCDVVAWEMLGLSMASWNGIVSVVLALIWLSALKQPE